MYVVLSFHPYSAVLEQYFYNNVTQRCEKFLHSGCGGNENRFETRGDCQRRCSGESVRVDIWEEEGGMVLEK